ncbi:MAG: 50S ribosomal protein L32 [Holosporales bacterium]|nr:50S ribosomal protein L32 [Holosporales bacterium]
MFEVAVPKKKTSKSKVRMRRSHDHIKPAGVSYCKMCGKACLPHHICGSCNTYNGRRVLVASAAPVASAEQG